MSSAVAAPMMQASGTPAKRRAKPRPDKATRPEVSAATVEQAKDPWARFADQWAFLNASDEEITAGAKVDPEAPEGGWPEEQVADLNRARAAYRTMYTLLAEASLGDLLEQARFDTFVGEYGVLVAILRRWMQTNDARFDSIERLWIEEMHMPTEPKNNLFGRLDLWLQVLHGGLQQATPSTMCICKQCRRIGPAGNIKRTYCDSTCRSLARYYRNRAERIAPA